MVARVGHWPVADGPLGDLTRNVQSSGQNAERELEQTSRRAESCDIGQSLERGDAASPIGDHGPDKTVVDCMNDEAAGGVKEVERSGDGHAGGYTGSGRRLRRRARDDTALIVSAAASPRRIDDFIRPRPETPGTYSLSIHSHSLS